MAMGKRRQRQESLFIMADGLPRSAGHPFYQALNRLLAEADFDPWIERRCQRYYVLEEKRGQPSIPRQEPKTSALAERARGADLRPRL